LIYAKKQGRTPSIRRPFLFQTERSGWLSTDWIGGAFLSMHSFDRADLDRFGALVTRFA
jgi:hypothetical protein